MTTLIPGHSVNTPAIVIVGAGASHVSGDYRSQDQPPLTSQLFDTPRARELLKTYTLARQARGAIKREMAAHTAIAFEKALRHLREDGQPHHAQMSAAVPPFLQALLLEYSAALRAEASRYEVLADELLKLPVKTCFVSVNYDTLLDSQLDAFGRLDRLDDYIDVERHWSLIKPHGSVAWFRNLPEVVDPRAPGDPLATAFHGPIECVPVRDLTLGTVRGTTRQDPHSQTKRYPAIALPAGPKDELVLPPAHHKFFVDTLRSAPEIQLLVLGYSGLDTEVLQLITGSDRKVRRLTVVNKDGETALEAFDRIRGAGIEPIWSDVYDGSFEQWIDGGLLGKWVEEYTHGFETRTDPKVLRQRLVERAKERQALLRASQQSPLTQRF